MKKEEKTTSYKLYKSSIIILVIETISFALAILSSMDFLESLSGRDHSLAIIIGIIAFTLGFMALRHICLFFCTITDIADDLNDIAKDLDEIKAKLN